MENIKVKGKVELFPQEGGWYYVRVPKKTTTELFGYAERGLIPVVVTLGKSKWDTSLLPMGDGTHFIALKKKVRKDENIDLGDTIELKFSIRGL